MILSTLFAVNPYLSLWGNYERQQGLWTQLSYLVLFLCIPWGMQTRAQHKLSLEHPRPGKHSGRIPGLAPTDQAVTRQHTNRLCIGCHIHPGT